MDKTAEILQQISNSIPPELQKKAIKTEDTFEQERYEMKKMASDSRIPKEMRRKLYEAAESEEMNRKNMVVNEEVEKKMGEYVEGNIQAAIRRGDLKHPDEVDDKWYRNHMEKMADARSRKFCECPTEICDHVAEL